MRLAVISDIHGNLVALEAVLADIKARGPDAIVNLGDCVTSPLWPAETLALLDLLRLATVRGNHDRWIAELPRARMPRTVAFAHDALTETQRAGLGHLPASIDLGDGILAVHGTPESDTEYLLEEAVYGRLALARRATLQKRLATRSAGLVLCGHSHMQHLASGPGDCLVLNPGSVGCPRYADNDESSLAEAGAPHAFYAIATRHNGRWSFDMIALAYDWSLVAAQAAKNGRQDWADAFLGKPD